jgi:hypothetical protein
MRRGSGGWANIAKGGKVIRLMGSGNISQGESVLTAAHRT